MALPQRGPGLLEKSLLFFCAKTRRGWITDPAVLRRRVGAEPEETAFTREGSVPESSEPPGAQASQQGPDAFCRAASRFVEAHPRLFSDRRLRPAARPAVSLVVLGCGVLVAGAVLFKIW